MPIYAFGGVAPQFPAAGRFWVADDANLIGKVRLFEDANVWFGATLRGDNEQISIGARSNIQEGCILHTDIGSPLDVAADCTIGHGVILHGCTIGAGSLIGMGAVVLNGAKIGKGCLVGAHALVTEGKVFAAGSLIMGSPAKAVRQLDADALEGLIKSAAHYVDKSRLMQRSLVRVAPER